MEWGEAMVRRHSGRSQVYTVRKAGEIAGDDTATLDERAGQGMVSATPCTLWVQFPT
jgi:hypothetical protein